MRWIFSGLLGLLLGCTATAGVSTSETPPASCPDFSGSYVYPGLPGLDSICSTRFEYRDDMPLPGPGGFYHSGKEPTTFKVVQRECRQLSLYVSVQDSAGGDQTKLLEWLLIPEGRGKQVRWNDDTLLYKRKFIPAGFRLPGQKQWMEIRLTKLEDGSLRYHLVHRERQNSKSLSEVECVWEPAGD